MDYKMKKENINFFCCGAQKAGTTTLHNLLIQHPDIYLPEIKEAHFFDIDERFEKGIPWYLQEFYQNYNDEKICGSITPEYLYFEEVPKRLYNTFGSSLKLIFVFRNPVDRAFSHYLMSKSRLIEKCTFEEAIEVEPKRISNGFYENWHFSYLNRGLYSKQLKNYLNYFDINQMYFINFEEDLVKSIDPTLKGLQKFLEIPEYNFNTNVKSNPVRTPRFKLLQKFLFKDSILKDLGIKIMPENLRSTIRSVLIKVIFSNKRNESLNPDIRRKLYEFYENDIMELQEITGKDFSNWNKT